GAPAKSEAPKAETPKEESPAAAKEESKPASAPATAGSSNGRVFASPLAKRIAEEKGIDIAKVPGSGEGGRIIKSDVDNYVPVAAPASSGVSSAPVAAGTESFEELPLTQMRKAIARSLAESQSTAVDFQLTMEINMDNAIKARTAMNETSPVKISFNDLV